jgi:rhomboid domain-containing protein 1
MLRRRHRGGGGILYALMLLYRLWERLAELEQKPPVTIALIALNIILYFARSPAAAWVLRTLPSDAAAAFRTVHPMLTVRASCINPAAVLLRGERYRLLLSTLIHLDDVHLLYNMISFVPKGVTLETQMGSATFAGLVVYLAIVSNVLYCAVAYVLKETGTYSHLWTSCAAGFSGVLFGLGAVLSLSNNYRAATRSIFGLTVPNAAAAMLMEVVATQMLLPHASLAGHACGAVAGLSFSLYTSAFAQRTSAAGRGRQRRRVFGSGVSGHVRME